MKKNTVIISHIIVWVLLISLDLVTLLAYDDANSAKTMFYDLIVDFICVIIAFYICYFFIAPRFLKKEKTLLYIIILIIFNFLYSLPLTIFVEYTHFFALDWIKKYSFGSLLMQNYSMCFAYSLIGTMFWFTINLFKESQKQKELEKQKLNNELGLLKSQINPKFLFDTLETVKRLINTNPSKASYGIIKLSEIMRYMLYEANEEFVSLDSEIIYIKNYIEIQKLTLKYPEKIKFYIEGNTSNKSIPPIMLIHFIENSFKHANIEDDCQDILIYIKISENEIDFITENYINIDSVYIEGGGIKNIKKRLNLLFPDNYNLFIKNEDNKFYVNLNFKLV